jgi:hydrogenase maturation protein HypF
VTGTVQGVGFRPWVYRLAREAGLGGWVRNDDGGVTIEAFGPDPALDAFVARLRAEPPPAARVVGLTCSEIAARPAAEFVIAASASQRAPAVSIPADLATCPACAAEIRDPGDRRHGYAFTNCTDCGPRYTIAEDLPYDRPATTMAKFAMCPECRREYDTPEDRRFHAQPNACPACGPRLVLEAVPDGALDVPDAIAAAAERILAGNVVAVKGLGGFHLACDATSPEAVGLLRLRKRRDEKPFAVMVADVAAAQALADITPEEVAALTAVERPIVLVPRRARASLAVADNVAPGTDLLGVMLPYTPLHHLLLRAAGRPLVMTSANLAEEPIVHRNEEARRRLGSIADFLLLHDRGIANRCDDSVVRVIAGAPTVLRRSRGWVPREIRLARPLARPVLACGAQLKNTFCLAAGDRAYLGPHVGDLDTLPAFQFFREAVARMERFVRIRPEIVAHDLHPDYLSTRYADERPETLRIPVQHHHAHVAAAMAEHGLAGPVLGLAYDGTGLGTDGAAWGGELLLAGHEDFHRLATFRPLPLPGGDRAVHEVWRLALALVEDAYGGAPPPEVLALFGSVPHAHLRVMRQMIARGLNTPRAHGVGRYFDAFGSLFLGRPSSRYEGQVATAWNLAADPSEHGRYPFAIADAIQPWSVDLRPTTRAAVEDFHAGRSAATIAARFHGTLIAASAELVRAAVRVIGRVPVVLAGGCFQNPLLAEGILAELAPELDVRLARAVPPGDGGLALGQAVVADAIARRM